MNRHDDSDALHRFRQTRQLRHPPDSQAACRSAIELTLAARRALDLFAAQTRNGKQFQKCGRKFRAQFVEKLSPPVLPVTDFAAIAFRCGDLFQRFLICRSEKLAPKASIERAAF